MAIVVGVATVFATIVFGYFTALRAQYERVIDVLDHVSSAEVAGARHRLGLMLHLREPVDDPAERTRDLFTVLWAFGRIDAVRQTLPAWQVLGGRLTGPHTLLNRSMTSWVRYWTDHVDVVSTALEADVRGSDEGLRNLTVAWL